MGISISLLLIAVGAILRFAVSATTSGIDLQTTGLILMIIGAIGAVLSLMFWASWGGFSRSERVTTSAAAAATPNAAVTPTWTAAPVVTEQVEQSRTRLN